MSILNFFYQNEDKYLVFHLSEKMKTDFLSTLPLMLLKCYVTEKEIKEREKNLGKLRSEIINEYIPDKANIMSAEFGEILSYYLLKELNLPEKLSGPKKWFWKEAKNKPIQKTDVVLFNTQNKPTKQDYLISAEVKCKATKKKNYSPIQDAIDGATTDYVERLAITLVWLKERYTKANKKKSLEKLERFLKPAEYGEYVKYFKAVAVIEEKLLSEEITKDYHSMDKINGNFQILIISIDGLKECYETVYKSFE
jgi:hypothetical protein